jgi:hypothetical protein
VRLVWMADVLLAQGDVIGAMELLDELEAEARRMSRDFPNKGSCSAGRAQERAGNPHHCEAPRMQSMRPFSDRST